MGNTEEETGCGYDIIWLHSVGRPIVHSVYWGNTRRTATCWQAPTPPAAKKKRKMAVPQKVEYDAENPNYAMWMPPQSELNLGHVDVTLDWISQCTSVIKTSIVIIFFFVARLKKKGKCVFCFVSCYLDESFQSLHSDNHVWPVDLHARFWLPRLYWWSQQFGKYESKRYFLDTTVWVIWNLKVKVVFFTHRYPLEFKLCVMHMDMTIYIRN